MTLLFLGSFSPKQFRTVSFGEVFENCVYISKQNISKYVLVRLFYLFVFAPNAYAKYIHCPRGYTLAECMHNGWMHRIVATIAPFQNLNISKESFAHLQCPYKMHNPILQWHLERFLVPFSVELHGTSACHVYFLLTIRCL